MNKYFDLHVHPSFKAFISKKKKDCWHIFDNILVNIVDSKGSLEQLHRGNVTLAVSTIYTFEGPLTYNFVIKYLAPLLTFLDQKRLPQATLSKNFATTLEELEWLRASLNIKKDEGKECKIITSFDEVEEGKINLILAIEGSHGLAKGGMDLHKSISLVKEMGLRPLYVTLIHMTQLPGVCTHAYSMKMIKGNNEFKPSGFGLGEEGKRIIDAAYRTADGEKSIFIDIKHMSRISRRDFYAYRKEKGYDDIPILATHMGVTGISSRQEAFKNAVIERRIKTKNGFVEVMYEKPKGIKLGNIRTRFNPWSLNLYDEEIPVIIRSGGLIGINMDQRILGADKVAAEFFSAPEFGILYYGNKEGVEYLDPMSPGEDFTEEPVAFGQKGRRKKRRHLLHLCNTILHIVKTAEKEGLNAWEHLCLGSDFDGLINPVDVCVSAEQFKDLEPELVEWLPKMMAADESYSEYDTTEIAGKVRDLMYNNGLRFLKKYYN